MSWIYTAVRKPTKADGNENSLVFVRWEDGDVGLRHVDFVAQNKTSDVAWMPIPPYTPLPPLPDGYRLLTNYSETPDKRAMILNRPGWIARSCSGEYDTGRIFCVPIKPPWVPAIVTAGVLKPGTWVCINRDYTWWQSQWEPSWNKEYSMWTCTSSVVWVTETAQITGEHAVWQVPE